MDTELRKTYLGATDLVAICGLSPWRKPGDVWMEKTGRAIGFEGNAATELGQDLEDVVALRHARRRTKLGEIVQLGSLPDPVFDPEHPFLAANVDRIYLNRKRVLECKTASEDQLSDARFTWGEDGEVDQVPVYYYAQTNHYIGILGYEDAFLSALFLGKKRIQRDYPIQFNPELFQKMRAAGVQFWQSYVEPDVQPPAEMFSTSGLMTVLAQQAQATAEADRFRLADLRYRNGVASYLDVLDAQRALFATQQALAQSQLAQRQNQVALYKALGGGWRDTAASAASAAPQN